MKRNLCLLILFCSAMVIFKSKTMQEDQKSGEIADVAQEHEHAEDGVVTKRQFREAMIQLLSAIQGLGAEIKAVQQRIGVEIESNNLDQVKDDMRGFHINSNLFASCLRDRHIEAIVNRRPFYYIEERIRTEREELRDKIGLAQTRVAAACESVKKILEIEE